MSRGRFLPPSVAGGAWITIPPQHGGGPPPCNPNWITPERRKWIPNRAPLKSTRRVAPPMSAERHRSRPPASWSSSWSSRGRTRAARSAGCARSPSGERDRRIAGETRRPKACTHGRPSWRRSRRARCRPSAPAWRSSSAGTPGEVVHRAGRGRRGYDHGASAACSVSRPGSRAPSPTRSGRCSRSASTATAPRP